MLEEFEKRLSVQLMTGRQIIAIDNINNELDGDLLNQSLTQPKVELRILGQSRKVTVRCSAVNTATGNNLRLVGDLTRRALIARLDPKTDRPELRQFDYDPVVDATEHRGELVAAALTILKAYCVAGMPGGPAKLQGFAEWSDLVRGALMWVGLEDPAATQERLRENDPKLTRLIRIATVWRKAFGAYATTVAEAVAKAEEKKRVEVVGLQNEPVNPDSSTPSWRSPAAARRSIRRLWAISQLRGRDGSSPWRRAPKSGSKGRERSRAWSSGPRHRGRRRGGSRRGRGSVLGCATFSIVGLWGVGWAFQPLYVELPS